MKLGVEMRAARQNEGSQRLELLIGDVHFSLKLFDVRMRDAGLLGMYILR